MLLQQQQRESQLLRNELDQEFGNAKQLRQRLLEQETVLLSLPKSDCVCAISWMRERTAGDAL